MFATLKRGPSQSRDNNSTSSSNEKHASYYADLEKRPDGRWSIQRGAMEAAVDAVRADNAKPHRETCCGFIPVHQGVLIFTVMSLIIGAVFMSIRSKTLAQNGASMARVDFIVTTTSVSLEALLVVTCAFGLYATWNESLQLVTIFLGAYAFHWVLDLASVIAVIVIAHQQDIAQPPTEVCLARGLEPGCKLPVDPMFILQAVGLSLFKIAGAYAIYVMYKYRHELLVRAQRSSLSPTSSKSSPKSYSPSHLSPLSPFRSRIKGFPRTPRSGRPWPPTNIPTIKIDLASDQSSASSYSNGSSGTGSAGFAVFEFAAKYPSLRTAPLNPVGENLKLALEKEREREEADLGLMRIKNAKGQDEFVDVPTLSKFSVVGRD